MQSGILIIDKPSGITSHGVVARLRRATGEKRIGHGGTLDPMATGVLPVFVGRATRAAEFFVSDDKEYEASFRLGVTTDTQDITGTLLSSSDVNVTEQQVKEVLREFTGEISQIPPMYSALKSGGKKLYELARQGIETERRPRLIRIDLLELTGSDGDEYGIRVSCSKGTYIRTLCHDIGARLGCGAAMTELRRTRSGCFGIEYATPLAEVERMAQEGELSIIPVDALFEEYPAVYVNPEQDEQCRNGAGFEAPIPEGLYRVYGRGNEFLMLGEVKEGTMRTVKSFFEVQQ